MQPPDTPQDFPNYNGPLPSPPGSNPTPGGYAPRGPQLSFDAITEAWETIRPHLGLYVGACLIVALICAPTWVISIVLSLREAQNNQPAFASNLLSFFNQFLFTVLAAGLVRMTINHLRNGRPELSDVISIYDVALPLIAATLLMNILRFVACCFCFVPMFIVNGLLLLTLPLIVDQRQGPITAMTNSWNALQPQMWMATIFGIVVSLVAGVGFLLCGVGGLVTVPLSVMTVSIAYRDFFLGNGGPVQQQPYSGPPIARPYE